MADAAQTWPTTATSIGVRPAGTSLLVQAPFGLDDLFGLIARPNKRQITRAIYEAKVARWRPLWPGLRYIEWEEE